MKPRALALPLLLGSLLVTSVSAAGGPTKHDCVAADDAAQDLRQTGKLRQAREKLNVCVSQSCPGPVREDCAQRLADIDGVMPSLVFEVKDGEGNDLSAVRVTMDGQPLAEKVDGSALQVDPGEHRFTFDDPDGLAHTEKKIVVREGDKNRHVRVVFGASAAPAGGPKARASSPPSAPQSDGGTQRTIGFVVGGLGIAGLVVGSIFGAMALGNQGTLKGECSAPNECLPSAQPNINTLHTNEILADVGLGVGVVGLAVGALLLFTAGPSEATPTSAIRLDVGPTSLAIHGGF